MAPGVFITLEGIDGSGKTTQVDRVVELVRSAGHKVVQLREPGGTVLSEKIRAMLLDPDNAQMGSTCELLLYEASRAQLVEEVIRPALECGSWVVCDRYFDSTFAYQAAGRGLDEKTVRLANALGSCGEVPTRTMVLDLDVEAAFKRATQDGADRMEAAGARFQERVRQGYIQLAEEEPERVVLVDATGTEDEVFFGIAAALKGLDPALDSVCEQVGYGA